MGLDLTNIARAAEFLAQQWPVFPCNAEKRPVTKHGLKDASAELHEVRAMFRAANADTIGVPTGAASGFVVVDLDLKEGASGLEWLAANEHRIPRTRRHRTRSGGMHLLFNNPAGRTIRNSASKVAPGVDVRGEGGYIISPPSPGYTISDDAMPADLPAWLLDLLDPPQAPRPAAPAPVNREDGTNGSRYGLKALSDECDAILGAAFGQQETTLNSAGLKIGALIAGGELERGYALESLLSAAGGMASQGGRPAWSPEELRRKITRAVADGSASPRQAPPREVRHTVRIELAPMDREAPPDDAYVDAHLEPAGPDMALDAGERVERAQPRAPVLHHSTAPWSEGDIPQRPWVVKGYLLRGSVTLAAGQGSAGKSSLMVAWAVSMALGAEYGRFQPPGPLRVLTYNVEDDEHEQQRRISAAARQFGATPARVAPNIMRVGPEEIGTLIEHDAAAGRFTLTPAWQELEALIADWRPHVVMLDPLAELHTAEENNNTALRHVVARIRSLARQHDFAAAVIHHIRKGGEAGDMDAVRGAGALVGAARTVFTVTPMSKEEAEEFEIPPTQRRSFFRLDNAKANYAPGGEANWHELVGIDLANGETVAAAMPWSPRNAAARAGKVAPDMLALIAAEVARGSEEGPFSPRLSDQQPRSVAAVFRRRGITEPADQRMALRALLNSGFTVSEWTDEGRRARDGLRAADGRPEAKWKGGVSA